MFKVMYRGKKTCPSKMLVSEGDWKRKKRDENK
jgi:hypothetical protein